MHTGFYINLPIGACGRGSPDLTRSPGGKAQAARARGARQGSVKDGPDWASSVVARGDHVLPRAAVGREPVRVGQFDGDRAFWERRGHICGVSRVGVPPWRRRAAAVFDAASAGYLLRLGNHVLLHGHYVRPALLPADLLPGSQEQHSAYGRCTHLADDHQPGHPCYVVRDAE